MGHKNFSYVLSQFLVTSFRVKNVETSHQGILKNKEVLKISKINSAIRKNAIKNLEK